MQKFQTQLSHKVWAQIETQKIPRLFGLAAFSILSTKIMCPTLTKAFMISFLKTSWSSNEKVRFLSIIKSKLRAVLEPLGGQTVTVGKSSSLMGWVVIVVITYMVLLIFMMMVMMVLMVILIITGDDIHVLIDLPTK